MLGRTARQLRSESPETRRQAAEKLGESGKTRAVKPLMRALADEDDRVEREARHALTKLGPVALRPLVGSLTGPDTRDWRPASAALTVIGDERAVKPLEAALRDSRSGVRDAALEALESMGWEPANDEQRVLRAIAKGRWSEIVALGPAAVDPLIQRATVFDSAEKREAIDALGQIGDRRALDTLITVVGGGLGVRPTLDPETFAAAAALRRIDPGWVDCPEARSQVRTQARRLTDKDWKGLAIGPLLTLGIVAPELLIAVFSDESEDPFVRAVALGVARKIAQTGPGVVRNASEAVDVEKTQERYAEAFQDFVEPMLDLEGVDI